jgi:hypothetical protein
MEVITILGTEVSSSKEPNRTGFVVLCVGGGTAGLYVNHSFIKQNKGIQNVEYVQQFNVTTSLEI